MNLAKRLQLLAAFFTNKLFSSTMQIELVVSLLAVVVSYFLQHFPLSLRERPSGSFPFLPPDSPFATIEAPPPTSSASREIGFDLDPAVAIVAAAAEGITEDVLLLRTFMQMEKPSWAVNGRRGHFTLPSLLFETFPLSRSHSSFPPQRHFQAEVHFTYSLN